MRWTRKATVAALSVTAAVLTAGLAVHELSPGGPARPESAARQAPTPGSAPATTAETRSSGATAERRSSGATAAGAWVGTWAVAVQSGGRGFERQTLRQIVHASIGGAGARVRLSNQFGTAPLTVGDVHVARHAGNGTVVPATDRPVTFAGAATVTIPAGSSAVSDAVAFAVPPGGDVAVSAYLPTATGAATHHDLGNRDNYVAAGDQSAAASISGAQRTSGYFFLAGLDVRNPAAAGAVVTLGASITDGLGSSHGADRRWPDLLAKRLRDSGRTVGVLNTGISGNRLIADGAGESALRRFERDVLAQPGVRWVIFSDDPLNDLGDADPPAGAELIDALKQLIARSHDAGVRFLCSTLTPFEGADYWTPRGESGRAAVNAFLHGEGSGCDAVIDQDTATHDPAAPTRFRAAYDSGDHLHPGDRGMQAIADAVDLGTFGPPRTP
jgi:lysophospholipase L1-like esterase